MQNCVFKRNKYLSQCLRYLRRGKISLLRCVHICVCCSLPSLASMGGERGQLSQNIFQTIPDIDFSTTSLAVFLPCYQLWIFLKIILSLLNSIQCWLPAIFKNSSNSISSPSKNIFALSTDISSIFGIRIDWYEMLNKLFFRSFDSTWGQCRNLRCLWSPLLKFGYSTKAWLPDFCRNPLHCSASTLWSEISLGRL